MIIDDERLAREELRRLLGKHPRVQIIDEARNADEAVEKIHRHKPSLLFLDVQMPGKTGFEMLEELDHSPHVIFTTAYDQYALRAFEVSALDYLLKPVEPKRLELALAKYTEPEEENTVSETFLRESDQVFVRDGERCWFVEVGSIRLLESEGNYTRIFFNDHTPLILRSLNRLEERLDPKLFFRANRQHIINVAWIEKIDPWFEQGLRVRLKGGPEIELSRRQAKKFKEQMSL